MKISKTQIKNLQEKIFSYYDLHGRDLPWRHTSDPYKILLSELMLQQTQVSRVIEYYKKWTTSWPTITHLAQATRKEVLQAWMGLGYNTRGINLHKASQIIVRQFHGDVLRAMQQYNQIPGVGKYTSQAVLIFSSNVDSVTVDTNIRRIFIHEFKLRPDVTDAVIWDIAQQCLPLGHSRKWHNALMDYGALVLTSKKTGIQPKTTQSSFEGSDRQIRAQILRQLLEKPRCFHDLKESYDVETERLEKILDKMIQQSIIRKEQTMYCLKES